MRRWLLPPAVLLLGWGLGFAWFVHVTRSATPPPPRADGIVVLTGGVERVQEGLRLLEQGAAPLLLVSGVGGSAEFPQLAHAAGADRGLAARVTLGHEAGSTHGNASETAEWVAANRIRALIVVTAGYHMPRALAELREAVPDVTLYPVAVQPQVTQALVRLSAWRLLAQEYSKFLAVELGLTQLAGRALAMERGG